MDISATDGMGVRYGPYSVPGSPGRPEARRSLDWILADIRDIRARYFRLGFHLREFERCGYYTDFGYDSLAGFAEANLGMGRSSLSRCLSVYDAFSSASDGYVYRNGVKVMTDDCSVGDRWKDFSYSQLCEMVPMGRELREQVTPDMTVAQIRDLKRKGRGVATSQQGDRASPGGEPGKKVFGREDLCRLKGTALSARVRACGALDTLHVSIFDWEGKPVHTFLTCDVLFSDSNGIVFRVVDPDNPLGDDA